MRYTIYGNNKIAAPIINSIGFSADINVTKFGPGHRSIYIIHYVLKGSGFYNGNRVNEGQGFLIYPGQLEEYYADMSNPWEFLWIVSSDMNMKGIFSKYNANPKTLIFDYNNIDTVKMLSEKIISLSSSAVDSFQLLEWYLQIFDYHRQNDTENTKSNTEIYLDFAVNYINNNIYLPIRISELTRLLGISQPYLYRIFSKKFGMSPRKYITEQKIALSKKMLMKTDISITQIANSVGFADVFSFSKFFSSSQGISPQKYCLKHGIDIT